MQSCIKRLGKFVYKVKFLPVQSWVWLSHRVESTSHGYMLCPTLEKSVPRYTTHQTIKRYTLLRLGAIQIRYKRTMKIHDHPKLKRLLLFLKWQLRHYVPKNISLTQACYARNRRCKLVVRYLLRKFRWEKCLLQGAVQRALQSVVSYLGANKASNLST